MVLPRIVDTRRWTGAYSAAKLRAHAVLVIRGDGMAIQVRANGNVQIVEMSGDFTIGASSMARPLDLKGQRLDDLGEILQDLFELGHRKILLDLHRVRFVDSSGLGELIAARKRAVKLGGDIKLLSPSKQVHKLLVMVSLTKMFEIFNDEGAAVGSF
jgi:anti-sigma B factor antagonist